MSGGAVLVTGGAGYIGSHAALSLLAAGREVVILDDLSTGVRENAPKEAAFVHGDIGDEALLARVLKDHKVSAIMHFAGSIIVPESVSDPGKYYRNNTVKSLALALAARDAGVEAMIFSSTAAVYAPTTAELVNEESTVGPISPYGASKLMTERMLADISIAHGLKVGVLRYFNVSGADPLGRTGQSGPNATHLLKVATQTALGQRAEMPIFGDDYPTPDGTCIRDYIHVSDLADAHTLALTHLLGGGESFTANAGYGRGFSVKEVLEAVGRLMQRPLPIVMHPRRPGDAPRLVADSSRLRALTNWAPKHDNLDTIISTAYAWEQRLAAKAKAD